MKTLFAVPAVLCAFTGSLLAQAPSSFLPNTSEQPAATALQGGTTQTPTTPPVAGFESGTVPGRTWVSAEYLWWWMRGDHLPPLVTTGTLDSSGILGPGTNILFGNSGANSGVRNGTRLNAGYFLDSSQTTAIEASFFILESLSYNFGASSPNPAVIARPFFNTTTNQQDAQLIGFPGVVQGSVGAAATSSHLLGAELLLRVELYTVTASDTRWFRIDGQIGYRFLDLRESISINENLTSLDPSAPFPVGTTASIYDQFATHNEFHGLQLGLASQWQRDLWFVKLGVKLGLGATEQVVNINGSTTSTQPGQAPVTLPGGVFALSSNMGRHEALGFSVVPELNLGVGYQLSSNWSIEVGYTFLFWTNVVRPGAQIDTNINPNLIPPVIPGGSGNPAFDFQRSSLWVQGISLGLTYRF